MGLHAFTPGAMAAVMVIVGVIGLIAIGSCSTFDPSARRRPPISGGGGSVGGGGPGVKVPEITSYPVEPDIRVRIKQGATAARIEAPGTLSVRVEGQAPASVSAPLTISSDAGSIVISPGLSSNTLASGDVPGGSGGVRTFAPGTTVTLIDARAAAGKEATGGTEAQAPRGTIRIDGVDYPGWVLIRPATDSGPGSFDIIADMSIEDYLPGVLAKELFSHWPLAAYEAQAVCARTYALFERDRDRAAGRFFDVESTQSDQVFGGATTNATALNAVRNTRGIVLTHEGKIFKTYYSSTCGGRASSAADVWPISKGFEYNLAAPIQGQLREHWCQQARLYRWEVTRPANELAKRLASWGRNSGHAVRSIGAAVASVDVQSSNQTTRPARYLVVDDSGRQFSLSAEELRVACNTSAEGVPAFTPQTRVNSGDLEFERVGGEFKIRGRGFGHGVGMCQWCLKGLADRGVKWNDQVLLFYPGAQMMKVYP
jgi:stage II sporulation protein D